MSDLSLTRILNLVIKGKLVDVRVAMPGVIVSYDKDTQRADVQPLIMQGRPGEGGQRVVKRIPQVTDVPIMFPGAGGYSETWPIAKGDTVLLVICSSAIGQWKNTKVPGPVDPGDDRNHAMTDAVAYAGIRNAGGTLDDVPDDAWCITVPVGKQIRIGSSAAVQSVPHGDTLRSSMNTLLDAVHTAVNALPGGTGAAATLLVAINLFKAAWPGMLSQKVKIE